jgi:hypothetical protein
MSGLPDGSTLLDLLEPGWRRHLASGEPAGALDVEPELLVATAMALGDLSRSGSPTALSRRWPACIVVAVAQVTARDDKNGKVWPAWFRATRLRASKRSAADWARAFHGSLAALGVPGLAGDPLETVLAHAAVTASCLTEFLRLARTGVPDAELSERDPALAALLRLALGPGFVGRCRKLMELLTKPDEPSAEDLANLSLPSRIVAAARTVAATHPAKGGWRPLRLDPFGRGVLARDAASDADQGTSRDGSDPDDTGSWIAMSPAGVGAGARVGVEAADALLAFDVDGEAIPAELPPEAVWLVYPADRALRADSTPRVLVESRLPLTWNGWRLVQLDLAGVAWLELEPTGGLESTGERRLVRGRTKPRLVPGASVLGVHTVDGLPVSGTLPIVRLPLSETRWRVEVRRSGSGPVLGAVETSGADWDPERLWERAPRPVLGELVITVTGQTAGLGMTGLRRAVVVAEGLDVSYSPALRLTDTKGLEPAEAVLSPAPRMTASPRAAMIPAEVTGVLVTCVAGPVVLPLRVTPPHCRVRIEPEPGSGDAPTDWHSLGPLLLRTADLVRGGALALDLRGTAWDPPVDVVTSAGTVQVLMPSKLGRYPLRRMLDTVRAHGDAELRITIGARTAVIARITASVTADDPWLSG